MNKNEGTVDKNETLPRALGTLALFLQVLLEARAVPVLAILGLTLSEEDSLLAAGASGHC